MPEAAAAAGPIVAMGFGPRSVQPMAVVGAEASRSALSALACRVAWRSAPCGVCAAGKARWWKNHLSRARMMPDSLASFSPIVGAPACWLVLTFVASDGARRVAIDFP